MLLRRETKLHVHQMVIYKKVNGQTRTVVFYFVYNLYQQGH